MRRRRSLLAGAVLGLGLVGAACLGSDATSGDIPVAEPPLPPAPEPVPPGDVPAPDELVEPTPGMADVRVVPWDESTVDGTTVTVSWWSGVAPCNVLDRVEVDEDDEVVTITLFEGADPAEPDAACIEIGVRKSTEVELAEPVGPRSLVDGADPASE